MTRCNQRITIDPAKNGFIVSVNGGDEEEIMVFTRKRQLMHYISKVISSDDLPSDTQDSLDVTDNN